MNLSMFEASVPVFNQMLNSLREFLTKAEAHAALKKIEPSVLLQARLFPDMFPLIRQVQVAADFAKGTCARLANVPVPSFADTEQTFVELAERINKTLTFINSLTPEQFADSQQRSITVGVGTQWEKTFVGQVYLFHYSLPHFFFHTTTAYDILRHSGVDVGKKDFVGAIPS